MDAPRALIFRPLVKGNEALGTRLEKHRITRHYSAKLQTTKQTFTTSKHAIEFTYSNFPCHFKVNRDKLALTKHRWMCKTRQKIDDYC